MKPYQRLQNFTLEVFEYKHDKTKLFTGKKTYITKNELIVNYLYSGAQGYKSTDVYDLITRIEESRVHHRQKWSPDFLIFIQFKNSNKTYYINNATFHDYFLI